MRAEEVLRRYAAGERDFRGANLRGANFKGKDLSSADFSGADIRSTNFSNATLRDADFSNAKAGTQQPWQRVQRLMMSVIIGISGILQGVAGAFSSSLLNSENFSNLLEQATTTGTYALITAVTYFAISSRGFSIPAISLILAAFIISVFVGSTVTSTLAGAVGTVAGVFAAAVAGTSAVAAAVAVVDSTVFIVASLLMASIAILIPSIATDAILTTIVVAPNLLLSMFVGWRVLKEDKRFDFVRTVGLALSTIGGTTFCGADLTGAIFCRSQLRNTNFTDTRQQETNLTHVRWENAQKLSCARLGITILRDRRVRTLLDGSQSGYKQDLSNANLRGANLSGLTLEKANLTRAILSGARLHRTMLEGATLTEAQAVGADFTSAYLTGAKLEGWNIDSTTTLKDIDCRHVFLLEKPNQSGDQERRPHDPKKDFQPGDFEKFFKEMLDEVQILIRDGIHPTAFRAAFQSIMQQNPAITPEAITGYEKRGTDVMITLQVPEGTNKAGIEQAWEEGYQTGLKAGREQEKLENADLFKETTLLLAGKNITFENRNELMTGNDQSQNIDVKGDFTVTANNSVVSLRDISGQVNNQIAQLNDSPTQTQLKDLLTQLETAIQSEPNLSEEQKAEALEEVKELAAAGQAPQDGPMKKAAKRAITTLKGMTVGVGAATKFVEACNGLLPAIALLFGL